MVEKSKMFCFAKIGSLWGSTSASLKIGEIWQSAKIWQVFETGGRTYFTLLVDRFTIYTNKIGSSATQALVRHCIACIVSKDSSIGIFPISHVESDYLDRQMLLFWVTSMFYDHRWLRWWPVRLPRGLTSGSGKRHRKRQISFFDMSGTRVTLGRSMGGGGGGEWPPPPPKGFF